MPRRTVTLLRDIQDAARYVIAETAGETLDSYTLDRRLRQAVERNFEIIGEAMRRLRDEDPETASRFATAHQIVGLRNLLAHGYDMVDDARVWQTIKESLPALLDEIERELCLHGP
ncbi:MAG: DUF86 domain-containing protein [Chloroflexia bacterium]|nr:DUF86 domain-containing protein [Chloroflexia bacterium]